jgi:hypothetical protein
MEEVNKATVNFLEELPEELSLQVLQFLDTKSLATCCVVSQTWKRLAEDDHLWLNLCRARWETKQYKRLSAHREQEYQQLGKKWKILYAEAEADAQRNKPTLDEICDVKWKFQFIHSLHLSFPVFKRDYTLHIDGRVLKWRWTSSGGIQVEQYPEARFSRLPDWGWQINNQYVVFRSFDEEMKGPNSSQSGTWPTNFLIQILSQMVDAEDYEAEDMMFGDYEDDEEMEYEAAYQDLEQPEQAVDLPFLLAQMLQEEGEGEVDDEEEEEWIVD